MFNIRPIAAAAALALGLATIQPTSARADEGAAIAGIAALFGIAAMATMANQRDHGPAYYHGPHHGDWYRDRNAYHAPAYAPVHRAPPRVTQSWRGNCYVDGWGRQVCREVSWNNGGYRRW